MDEKNERSLFYTARSLALIRSRSPPFRPSRPFPANWLRYESPSTQLHAHPSSSSFLSFHNPLPCCAHLFTGKNNGTVQGVSYFKCPDNHGMFVRQTQIETVKTPKKAGAASGSETASPALRNKTTRSATSSNASVTESHEAGGHNEVDSQASSRRSSFSSQSAAVAVASTPTTPAPNVPRTVTEEAANNAPLAAPPASPPVKSAPPPAAATPATPVTRQPQQSITIPLRSTTVPEADPVRVRELEMLRKQVDTMQQYKQNWMEKQQQLQKTISELERHSQMEHERLESELVLQTETAELALLDKQVAEEKVRS